MTHRRRPNRRSEFDDDKSKLAPAPAKLQPLRPMRSLKSALHAIAGMVYSVQGVVGDGDIAGVVAT